MLTPRYIKGFLLLVLVFQFYWGIINKYKLYILKVHNVKSWYVHIHTLWNDYHDRTDEHIHSFHMVTNFYMGGKNTWDLF